MNVLLTGSQGFIGSNVVRHLQASHPQIRFFTLDKAAGATVTHDLTEPLKWSSATPIDAVLHLAAMSGVRDCTNNVVEYNTSIAKNITDWATANKVKLIVHASSSSVYGTSRTMNESHEPRPASKYALSKLKAEDVISEWAEKTGSTAIHLRLFNNIGQGQRHNMLPYLIAQHLNSGQRLQLFGQRTRGWTYVGDTAKAMGEALLLFVSSKAKTVLKINVGTGYSETQEQLIWRFEAESGRKAQPELIAAHPMDLPSTQADTYRFFTIFGWVPTKDDVNIGVREVLADLEIKAV